MLNRIKNKKNADGLTLVHIAAKNTNIEQLTILKKLKANFRLRTNDNETPLLLLCKHMPSLKIYTLEEMQLIDLLTYKSYSINISDNKGYTPLHYAARLCSGRVVEKLIRLGAQVNNQTNDLQLTPLHCAMQSSRLDVVDTLIRHGAKINPVAIDGITPLHLAVASSSTQIVKYLIDLGAKINYRENFYFYSPMHVALLKRRADMFYLLKDNGADINLASRNGITCLHLASIIGDVEIVDKLIRSGADVNCREKNDLITPIHIALSKGKALNIIFDENSLLTKFLRPTYQNMNPNYNAIFFSLLKHGADLKSVSRDGKTALHFALEAVIMETDIIEVLIDSEIDLNAKQSDTLLTPLLIASREGLDNVILKLVKHGADVNAVTKDGKSSLHFAIEFCNDPLEITKLLLKYGADTHCTDKNSHFTPLHVAANLKTRKDIIKELINAAADVNALTKDGRNTLHLAAESGDPDNVKVLIERGVNVNCKENVSNYTALHLAVIKTRVKVIEELVNGDIDVNAKNNSGKTAIHLATCYRDKMVEILVKCGACIDLQDNKGFTPIHYAIEHNNELALKVMLESGMNINDILLCRQFVVKKMFDKSDIKKLVLKHLIELKALRFPIANEFNEHVAKEDFKSVYYKNCVNEIVMLKAHLLSIKVSLYDFLHMDPDSRFTHIKNVMSSEVKGKFRIYKSFIENSYREAVERKPLVEPARLALNWLVSTELPVGCTKMIFSFLKSWHLKAIVEATQNEKNAGEILKTRVCSVQ